MYSYILGSIRHYMPNTFLAFSNLRNGRILANTLYESQFSQLLVNLCEDAGECWRIFGIHLFSENWHMYGSACCINLDIKLAIISVIARFLIRRQNKRFVHYNISKMPIFGGFYSVARHTDLSVHVQIFELWKKYRFLYWF